MRHFERSDFLPAFAAASSWIDQFLACPSNASFLALCRADKEIGQFLSDDELVALFDMGYHTKHVDTIFKRVFG